MRVAILGAGSIAFSYAAVLASSGHEPVLWSPSNKGATELAEHGALVATGLVEGTFPVAVADSCANAVDGADAAIVAVPGTGHRAVFDALAPALKHGQCVIISSHCSMGALYLAKRLAERDIEVPIAAWATTLATGRRTGGHSVNVTGVRKRLDLAAVPASAAVQAQRVCQGLFGDRFELRDDLLAIALSNLNPPAHMANALCNFTRIEKGEAWANYDGITPAVGRLIEALDEERIAAAAAFGVTVRTIYEHYRLSFPQAEGETVAEMASAIHRKRNGPAGPTSLDTRFVVEDVPFGLVPMVALARQVGVATPLHEAGIVLFSALYGRDFQSENDLLPNLGMGDLESEQVRALVRDPRAFAAKASAARGVGRG